MSINVTIVNTANRMRRFAQSDETRILEVLETLRRSAQLFTARTLILSSDTETEIFSPASITRIEIATQRDISSYLPQHGETWMAAIDISAEQRPTRVEKNYFAGRVDCYFEGGDMLASWIEGPLPAGVNERLMIFTLLFDQPFLMYSLPQGGIGLANPKAMTRVLINAPAEQLPVGAWRLNPV